jgi:GNAT superfamily N-acetyltransferase
LLRLLCEAARATFQLDDDTDNNMSHYPWILQERFGIARPPDDFPRTETLDANTPATFVGPLNWNHCENGSANPTARPPGTTILMGAPITAAAGTDESTVLPYAARQLREAGWVVDIVPEDYHDEEEEEEVKREEEDETNEERSAKRPKIADEEKKEQLDADSIAKAETRYIKSGSYWHKPIAIKDQKSGNVVGRMSTLGIHRGWLCIVSTSDVLTESARNQLQGKSFALGELKCTEFSLTLDDDWPGYTLTGVTGVEDHSASPSTLFTLKFGTDKIVGKALCTYQNGGMGSVGPTLELIEIAKEWRRHGLGKMLMDELQYHFQDVYQKVIEAKGDILFSICDVTTRYASQWFQNKLFFSDLDGMGEELGMRLENIY